MLAMDLPTSMLTMLPAKRCENLPMTRQEFLKLGAAAMSGAAISDAQQAVNPDLGFKDTPMEPGMPWHVHDPDRPHPKVISPASTPGAAPSDAIVLFDGKDLSKWYHRG